MLTFIEGPIFARDRARYLDDDNYAALQRFLTEQPDAGDLVPGSGGARKVRWGLEGRGKRGGVRILYYWADGRGQIWLLLIYGKNVQENIAPETLRRLKETFHGKED